MWAPELVFGACVGSPSSRLAYGRSLQLLICQLARWLWAHRKFQRPAFHHVRVGNLGTSDRCAIPRQALHVNVLWALVFSADDERLIASSVDGDLGKHWRADCVVAGGRRDGVEAQHWSCRSVSGWCRDRDRRDWGSKLTRSH